MEETEELKFYNILLYRPFFGEFYELTLASNKETDTLVELRLTQVPLTQWEIQIDFTEEPPVARVYVWRLSFKAKASFERVLKYIAPLVEDCVAVAEWEEE